MVRLTCLLLALLLTLSAFSQATTENQKLESLCKVWGFLKYHHPEVTKGKIDWDQQLIKMIPAVISSKDKNDLSNLYLDWIGSLGKVRTCRKSQNTVIPDSLKYNLNIDFIRDKNLFSDSLIEILDHIYTNRSRKTNYNTNNKFGNWPNSYEDKQPYEGMVFPGMEYRLLSLFRFWNVINYYSPNKYLIGEDWNAVLSEMIDKFKNTRDTLDYHLALAELTAKTNDGHCCLTTGFGLKYFGHHLVPFNSKIIDDKAVVMGFYNDSLSKLDDIRHGDVILVIDDKSIPDIIAKSSKYLGSSTINYKLYRIAWYMFNGNSDSAKITYDRGGNEYQKWIHRYWFKDLHVAAKNYYYNYLNDTNALVKILKGKIGYINMGKLQRSDVSRVMKQVMPMDAIIFDLRNYPNETSRKIAGYLSEKRKSAAITTSPLKGNPGVFEKSWQIKNGSNISHYYKGKVILLVNELTISQSEYTCMTFQALTKTTVIGSQTAGADGDIAYFTFPGGYKTYFTSIGIFYPDGRQTQRIGIVPDIKVEQTIEGIAAGKDETLDRAIEYINTGK